MESIKRGFCYLIYAICAGVYIGYLCIRPYDNVIGLEELVFQFSGARGEIALDTSIVSLLHLISILLPYILFLFYGGVEIYHHFCVASIYVFGRIQNRKIWYAREWFGIAFKLLVFHTTIIGTVIVYANIRYSVTFMRSELTVLYYHFIILYLRLIVLLMISNLASLVLGDGSGTLISIGIWLVETAIFPIMEQKRILQWNPSSYIIIGWMKAKGINLTNGIFFFGVEIIVLIIVGLIYIDKYDFIPRFIEER